MAWVFLLAAIGLEVSGTTCMKLSDGFSRTIPSLLVFVFYGGSVAALTLAVQHLDIGLSYAVWSGVGTALIAVIGIAWFGEPFTLLKAVALVLIIVGVATINLAG